MKVFNDRERDHITRWRDQSDEAVGQMLDKLAERRDKRGEVSYRLGWDCGDFMYHDLNRAAWDELLVIDEDRDGETRATLETLIDYHTRRVLEWRPSHSTNPFSNVEAELKHRVNQNLLEKLCSLKQIRLQDEAEAANDSETKEA